MRIGDLELHDEDLATHIRIMGKSGTGKSTLLYSILTQLIMDGGGFALLDPHGELYYQLLSFLTYIEYRESDVFLIDATEEEVTATVNPFTSAIEPEAVETKAQVLTDLTLQVWGKDSEAVRAEKILYVLYIALLEQRRPLSDILAILAEPGHIQNVFARTEWEQMRGKAYLDSVTTRLKPLTHSRLKALTSPHQAIDFSFLLQERILLANLSRSGIMGEKECKTLSAFLVTEIWAAAFSRKSRYPPFYLVVDEFKVLATEELASILTQAQKFGLHLIFLHQTENQLPSFMRDAVGNSSCFIQFVGKGKVVVDGWGSGLTEAYFDSEPEIYSTPTMETAIKLYREKVTIPPRLPLPAPCDLPDQSKISEFDSRTIESSRESASQTITNKPPLEKPAERLPSNGRGGSFHRSIQDQISRVAAGLGYRVQIEKPIGSDSGVVDISLEREELRIACEVSVTTTANWEVQNILKCIRAGYQHVWVITPLQKNIQTLTTKIRSVIPAGEQAKIKVFSPENVYRELRKLDSTSNEKTPRIANQRMTVEEVAEFYGISTTTVYRMVAEKRMDHYRIGRMIFFDRDEVVEYGKYKKTGKQTVKVQLEPASIEKPKSRTKKQRDDRYRKMLKLD